MHETGERRTHQRIFGPDYRLPSQHRGRGLSRVLPPRVDLLPEGYTYGRGYPTGSAMRPIPRVQAPGTGDEEMEMGDAKTGDEEMETGDAKTGDEEDSREDRGRTRSKI